MKTLFSDLFDSEQLIIIVVKQVKRLFNSVPVSFKFLNQRVQRRLFNHLLIVRDILHLISGGNLWLLEMTDHFQFAAARIEHHLFLHAYLVELRLLVPFTALRLLHMLR